MLGEYWPYLYIIEDSNPLLSLDNFPRCQYGPEIIKISGGPMTKSDLISALGREFDITKQEATSIVRIFLDDMSNALANGERVEIRGLCSFYIKKYKAYTGRNPKTGTGIKVKPKKLPFFKCGKELKERVNV